MTAAPVPGPPPGGAAPEPYVACADEPIRFPGGIQPYGALMVVRAADLTIVQASENVADVLGTEGPALLGEDVRRCFSAADGRRLARLVRQGAPIAFVALRLRGRGRDGPRLFAGTLHVQGGWGLLELEPTSERAQASFDMVGATASFDMVRVLVGVMDGLRAARGLCDALDSAVAAVRGLTGYDRVMAYRFDADGHGEVVAEARRADLAPYLGQHYPASDIPAQARALYLQGWLRYIPDARYQPVPLKPTRLPTGEPVDLGPVTLRAVSPVHLEYLANMGVAASATISLIVEGRLWGLLACHHQVPHALGREVRLLAELVGVVLSGEIRFRELRERAARTQAVFALQRRLADALAGGLPLADALAAELPGIMCVVGAHGATLTLDGAATRRGATPDPADGAAIGRWLAAVADDGVFAADQLPLDLQVSEAGRGVASGVLAIALPGPGAPALTMFRPEQPREVRWGGDPRQPYLVEGSRISPRRSFAVWRETVRGRSVPWSEAEVEAARQLRALLMELLLAHRQQAELARLREVERLRELLGIVAHELRTPLTAIEGYAEFLQDDVGGPLAPPQRAFVLEIRSNAGRLARLIDDLLDATRAEAGTLRMDLAPDDLVTLARAAVATAAPRAQAAGVTLELGAGPASVPVRADHARVLQILGNLLANAIAHTPAGGRIRVDVRPAGAFARAEVQDDGPGVAPEHREAIFEKYFQADAGLCRRSTGLGLGLHISTLLVRAHGGAIGVDSPPGGGACFWFTLPLAGEAGPT